MSVPDRPNCAHREACTAKGSGHCRSCAAAYATKARAQDPRWRLKLAAVARVVQNDPAVRAAQAKSRRANPVGVRRVKSVSRKAMLAIRANPALMAKCDAARKMAEPATRHHFARKIAKRHGIPLQHVAEFRALVNDKKIPVDVVVGALRASYPLDFVDIDQAARLAAFRAAGPAPAIGTPARTRWTRKVNAASSRVESRPC